MVDIADGAVAKRSDSGYDKLRAVPDFDRMIGLAFNIGIDWKGTHP